MHFQGGGGAQKPLWCLDSSCGFVSRKLKKQAIYPQHLWESQPSYMERRDLFASHGMEITVLSAAWKTLPNVTYENKMALVNAQHKIYVCVNIYMHTNIYGLHMYVCVHACVF